MWNVYRQFDAVNAGRSWFDRVKPFNFFVRAAYAGEWVPAGVETVRHIIQTYGQSNPSYPRQSMFAAYERTGEWLSLTWYRTRDGARGARIDEVGLTRLGDVVRAYDNHPEYPYYGPDGQSCTKYTRGVMQRRPVAAVGFFYTGKQVPALDVDWDRIEDEDYDPRVLVDGAGREWANARFVLRDMGAARVAAALGENQATVEGWLSGKHRPADSTPALRLAVEQAGRVSGVTGLVALDAYAAAREKLVTGERAVLSGLSPRAVMQRYGVSRRQAQRYLAGQDPPPRNILLAQQGVGTPTG